MSTLPDQCGGVQHLRCYIIYTYPISSQFQNFGFQMLLLVSRVSMMANYKGVPLHPQQYGGIQHLRCKYENNVSNINSVSEFRFPNVMLLLISRVSMMANYKGCHHICCSVAESSILDVIKK